MVQIKNPLSGGGGGGDVVNGVVEQFLSSGEDIEANTFVEFVQSIGTDGTVITPGSMYFTAVALTDTDVFVEYASSNYPTAVIVSFDGENITVGTAVRLTSASNHYLNPLSVKMTSAKVFVIEGSTVLYGYVCTVAGQAISVGTMTQISSTYGIDSNYRQAIRLDDNNLVLMGAGSANNYYLRATLITISGSSSSVSNNWTFGSDSYGGCWPALDLVETSDTTKAIVCANIRQGGTSSVGNLVVRRFTASYSNGAWILSNWGSLATISASGSTSGPYTGSSTWQPVSSVAAFMINDIVGVVVSYMYYSSGHKGMRATVAVGSQNSTIDIDQTSAAGARQVIFSKKFSSDGKGEIKMLYGTSSGNINNSISLAKIRVDGTDLSVATYPIMDGSYLGDVIIPVETTPLRVLHPASSAYPINAFELTEEAKASQFKIDGLTASEVTSTTPGDVWVLNGGGVILDEPRYIVYNCAFRAERRA